MAFLTDGFVRARVAESQNLFFFLMMHDYTYLMVKFTRSEQ